MVADLPNVKLVQIASKDFDEYEPCQHLLGNLWPYTVEVESKRTTCVSKIYTFIANVPVICNHCPPHTGNSGDYDFPLFTALLKALHCGDLLRVIAPLFININFSLRYVCVV